MTGIELNLDDCTLDAETCPIVFHLIERDYFESAIASLDPEAETRRQILGNFVTACVKGTCPAQDPELARQIIKEHKGRQ